MTRFTTYAIGALLLVMGACETTTPSSLASVDPVTVDAKGDAAVVSEIVGDASNPLNIQSDGLGAYRNSTDGVVSIIQGIGDWELDLSGRRSTRKASVNFSDTLPGNPGAAPFTAGLVAGRFIAKATQLNSGGFTSMVGLGSTRLSPLSLAFTKDGVSYGLRMNTANHAETDYALVTCTGVVNPGSPETSACNKWRVTPNASHDSVAKNVAYLERVGSPSVFLGLFYMTFDVVVTK